jgi:class 3 adenylate cyclase
MDRRQAQLRRRHRLFVHLVADGLLVALAAVVALAAIGDVLRNDLPIKADWYWPVWVLVVLTVPLGLHTLYVLSRGPLRREAIERLGRPAGGQRADQQPDDRGQRILATVLFTDIVGSTERARQLGDRRWGELLDLHDRTAGELVGRWLGRLVKLTGDGVLAVFDRPERAIRCAAGLRDSLGQAGLPIRAGLHAGEVVLRGPDVGGIAVHIGARVMAAAGTGEILVSGTVHDLVTGAEVAFEDRGSYELKGVDGQWRLFAVSTAPGQEAASR